MRTTHGRLDVQTLDVLPVLLQEGDQEVDGHEDVLDELFLGEGNVTDGNTQAEDLLQLKLDGLPLGIHEVLEVSSGLEEEGELLGSVQGGTEDTGDGTDERLRGEEDIVLLSHLLDDLLVLVEGLQLLNGLAVDAEGLGLIAIGGVTEDAELEVGLAGVPQDNGGLETLVTGGIIVLQTNLELDGLDEVPLLGFVGVLQDLLNGTAQGFGLQLAHVDIPENNRKRGKRKRGRQRRQRDVIKSSLTRKTVQGTMVVC